MRHQTAYRLFLACVTLAALFVVYSGWRLKYYGALGPGPGFFPVWIGALLAVVGLVALVQTWVGAARDDKRAFVDDHSGGRRVLAIVLALLGVGLGLKFLGFRLTMLVFVLMVPSIIERQKWWLRITLALLLSFGVGLVFERWLGVELPRPSIEWLQDAGL